MSFAFYTFPFSRMFNFFIALLDAFFHFFIQFIYFISYFDSHLRNIETLILKFCRNWILPISPCLLYAQISIYLFPSVNLIYIILLYSSFSSKASLMIFTNRVFSVKSIKPLIIYIAYWLNLALYNPQQKLLNLTSSFFLMMLLTFCKLFKTINILVLMKVKFREHSILT